MDSLYLVVYSGVPIFLNCKYHANKYNEKFYVHIILTNIMKNSSKSIENIRKYYLHSKSPSRTLNYLFALFKLLITLQVIDTYITHYRC